MPRRPARRSQTVNYLTDSPAARMVALRYWARRALTRGVQNANGGLILAAPLFARRSGNLIVSLAERRRLPAIYPSRIFTDVGGLLSYGPDLSDQYRLAAGYVDRILRGEKPGDLPVQAPTKYELAINLKTAKTLGLIVPASLLAHADEVIE